MENNFEFLTFKVVRKGGSYRAPAGATCPKDPGGPTAYTYIKQSIDYWGCKRRNILILEKIIKNVLFFTLIIS